MCSHTMCSHMLCSHMLKNMCVRTCGNIFFLQYFYFANLRDILLHNMCAKTRAFTHHVFTHHVFTHHVFTHVVFTHVVFTHVVFTHVVFTHVCENMCVHTCCNS